MRHTTFWLLLLLLTSCAAPHRKTASTPREKRYVVILSMDAFRWDLAGRSHTPTLDSLARVGSYAEIFPVYPSNTFPSHYSMATGLHPDHHGVVNNKFYDRTRGRNLSVFDSLDVRLPDFWGGEPIWNTVERQGMRAQIFMWPGSEVPINGRQASSWMRYSPKPSYYQRADWVIKAMTRPENEIPELVMWYFEQPDSDMHTFGPESPQVIARAEHIDSVLCYFFREIRRSPVFEKIDFIVTADHGMAEVSPERYLNLYSMLDSTQIKYTVSGIPLGLEVRDEYCDEALRILNKTEHVKAWRREELPQRFHYGTHPTRLTNLILIPETGWTIEYAATPRRFNKRGSHGFDNRDRDMHMVFYAAGPDFRQDYRQKPFQNQNIYLLICQLLGVEPAPNDGSQEAFGQMIERNR